MNKKNAEEMNKLRAKYDGSTLKTKTLNQTADREHISSSDA